MSGLSLIPIAWAVSLTCTTQPPALQTNADPGSDEAPLASQNGVVTRRVWSGPGVDFLGSPSPDGKLLAFAEWSTGNLGVRDLETGQNRSLTGKRDWAESNSYAENSAFSPDGRRIAYSWANDSTNQHYELRVLDIDGTNPKVLVASADIDYFGPPAWSPNGREIGVGIVRGDGIAQLALVSAETGAIQVLKSFDWRDLWKVSFSRDGRFLAYDFPPDDTSRVNEVFVIARDGSRETRVTNHPAHDRVIGWAADGRHLLFHSDRAGTEGVWAVPLADGRVEGAPVLVRRDLWQSYPIGLSRDALYYGVNTENRSLFVATVDLEQARTISPPTPELMRLIPWPLADWSPDGSRIAFGVATSRGASIGILTLGSTEVGEIATPLDRAPNRVRWSPDGKSLLAVVPQRGQYGIFRIDLQTGRTERLVSSQNAGGGLAQPEIARDGRTLYFRRGEPEGGGPTLVARDLATGAERIICRCGFMVLALSPDGQRLAFITGVDRPKGLLVNTIRVISSAGGEASVVYQPRNPSETLAINGGLAWSNDSRRLLFVRGSALNEPTGSEHELMVMPAEGGEPRRLFSARSILGIRMHPDGRRILFTGGSFKGEVWVMENLPVHRQVPATK